MKVIVRAPSTTLPETPKPFQPANGSEGLEFTTNWCGRCMCDDADPFDMTGTTCPILDASYALKITDPEYPPELIEDERGYGRCTAFVYREPGREGWLDPRAVARDRDRYNALPRDPVTGRPVIA